MQIRSWSFVLCLCLWTLPLQAAWIWVEGENPTENRMNRHPWWYDQVKKDQFSGTDFISNFHQEKAGEAVYVFQASEEGNYEFWVRANPLMARLEYGLNGSPLQAIDLAGEKRGETNVAADAKPDLRFLAWARVGQVKLKKGDNRILFRMSSDSSNHGYLDCFVFSSTPFQPRGTTKPDQMAAELERFAAESRSWSVFDPQRDAFQESPIDLRHLNQKFAGEHGHVIAKDGQFVFSTTGEPVRFWAVNGPPHQLTGEALRDCARMLAKKGVNLVRVHSSVFDKNGEVDMAKVHRTHEIVRAMKAEGIYCHFSIYFPLWMKPAADTSWLQGYDGSRHPFAALLFNESFQQQYRKWWEALLTTKDKQTGLALVDDPAVFGVEIQNEDSFFFWTFDEKNIPDPQLRILEKMFAQWLVQRYGSLDRAFERWKGARLKRDVPAEGRVAFRPLWAMFNEKSVRDQDTAAFLLDVQTGFYRQTYSYLRKLGFKGLIHASNWTTASPEVFGPLEKLSYTVGDFVDRHGYFSCNHKGEFAEWSVREGHTYSDRSALRFDPEQPGKPKAFVHPGMDPHYGGKPSMLSESTWNRPNRYRTEAPIYFAAYGALQDSDAIVHFALDGAHWAVKPGFFMQPWTLMSPTMMGQFPAASLIYRLRLVSTGALAARVHLDTNALLRLEGTPLPQDAALDELRLKDLPAGYDHQPGSRIDPLVHFVGRTEVTFGDGPGSVELQVGRAIDRKQQQVTSGTGQLHLDYGTGLLKIDAPRAQGISGHLGKGGLIQTTDFEFESGMELGNIVVVSLDGKPLSQSARMLLQVMSEEKSTGFATESAGQGTQKIVSIGTDPWMIKELKGSLKFRSPRDRDVKVQALDLNGYPSGQPKTGPVVDLAPATIYYLLTR